jgi:DNA invertase Pin-like site-specific DNA recombinase
MSTAIAYIRKSSAPSKHTRTVSFEVQEQAVRDLAGRHGDELAAVLTDWGRSGGSTRRPDYQRLLAMVDAGEVATIYSYSLSRLSRSVRDFADLVELCAKRDVRIRFVQEGEVDHKSATGRLFVGMVAQFAQFERELAAERNQAAVAERRERGDVMGQAPYGSRVVGGKLEARDDERPDLVFEAFRQAGSFAGAAKLLNAWNVPTRREGTRWIHGTVADIIRAQAPAELRPPIQRRQGAAPLAGAMFAGLLRCPCGAILTPRKDAGAPSGVSGYYCSRSTRTPGHGKMHTPERVILEWAIAEAARLRIPAERVTIAERASRDLVALEAKRSRIVETYIEQLIDKAERDRRLAEVDAERDRLEAVSATVTIPPAIDWDTWTPRAINRVLHALWTVVELDAELLPPVAAEWTVPEWRAA